MNKNVGRKWLLLMLLRCAQYVQLAQQPHEETFICKVANNTDDAAELIEVGFDYVTGEYEDGGKLFRKRKLSYLGA